MLGSGLRSLWNRSMNTNTFDEPPGDMRMSGNAPSLRYVKDSGRRRQENMKQVHTTDGVGGYLSSRVLEALLHYAAQR